MVNETGMNFARLVNPTFQEHVLHVPSSSILK
jgi:hypothetical protein